MRCACWRPRGRRCWRPAWPTRRSTWSSTARPGTCASCCRWSHGARPGSPICAAGATSVRSTSRIIQGWTWRRPGTVSTTTSRPSRSTTGPSRPAAGRRIRSPMRPGLCCGGRRRRPMTHSPWRPATLDRPAYYDVLRLAHLGTILRRLEILPQAEIGQLVNLAVLAQAAVIALLVLLVPVVAGQAAAGGWRRHRAAGDLLRGTRPGLPVHRDRGHRAGQPVPERPDLRLRDRVDGDAGVLRPWQPPGGAGGAGWDRHRLHARGGLVHRGLCRAAASHAGDAQLAVAGACWLGGAWQWRRCPSRWACRSRWGWRKPGQGRCFPLPGR